MKARIRPLAPCALVWNYSETEPGFAALADACRAEGLVLIRRYRPNHQQPVRGPRPRQRPRPCRRLARRPHHERAGPRPAGRLSHPAAGRRGFHPAEGDGHPHQPELDSGRSAGRACAGTGCLCRPCRSMNMHKKRNKSIFYAKSADLYSFCNQTVIFYSALLH